MHSLLHFSSRDHLRTTDYSDILPRSHRSVPTRDDILVPETLLKKRKSQEKEREAKSAESEKKKAVCRPHCNHASWAAQRNDFGDDNEQIMRLDHCVHAVVNLTIFRD